MSEQQTVPGAVRVRHAAEKASALCADKKAPLTRERLAAELGVCSAQLEEWARREDETGAAVRAALQQCLAEVLEYCLRPDVRHEQLAALYLKSAGGFAPASPGRGEPVQFTGEEEL